MTCWWVRTWLSLHLDRNEVSCAWTRRHLERCPACQEYRRSQLDLVGSLRVQAPSARPPAPPFLKARVLAAVARAEAADEQRPSPRFRLRPWWVGAAAATAGGAAAVWMALQPPPPSAAWPSELATTLFVQGTNQLARIERMETPLEKEVGLVIRDAKTALWAVADGVLPTTLLASTGDGGR